MEIEIIVPNHQNNGAVHLKTNKKRVVGYARVSTDKDEQFTSYEAQIEYYTNYIKSKSDWEFIKIYTDEGLSGTSTKHRLGFQSMMKDALKGKFDLIITKSISRFARNTLDSLMAIRKLKENNVEIYFEKENIWTLDSKGELLITIMSSIAQEESRSISANVTWGIRQSMKKGKAYVPYKVFLGYKKGINGEMEIDEEQAKIVRKIYAMAIQDRSYYCIAKELEKEGIPFSPGVYKWYPSTVKSILRNEKYKGDAIRQKTYTIDYLSKTAKKNNGEIPQYYIHNHHPAIIPAEIFDRLQIDLNNRPKDTDYKRSKNMIFSKKIICPCCGGYYGPLTWKYKNQKEVVAWSCNNKFKKPKGERCTSPFLKEESIKQSFIVQINQLITDKTAIINILIKIIKKIVPNERYRFFKDYLDKLKNESNLIKSFDEDIWFTLLKKSSFFSKEITNMIFRTGIE